MNEHGDQSGAIQSDPGPTYAKTWQIEESLDDLNKRIHDGAPVDGLLDRGRAYRDLLFRTFPDAAPSPETRMMELGSGVGWIMEAMLEQFEPREIIGLDISANMIKRAQERFADSRASFVLYDGLSMPFEDGSFDVLYSVAAMQHIEKHAAFLLFEELHRVLAPGGHAVIHLLGVAHIPGSVPAYHQECLNHVHNVPGHWHHYYSFDELFILFAELIGVTDLDIVTDDGSHSFLVHFGKGGATPFRDAELPQRTNWGRRSAPAHPPVARLTRRSHLGALVPERLKPLARRIPLGR
jgi:ubiquinone/menaquinone biosynthesis C-methylase UbiE